MRARVRRHRWRTFLLCIAPGLLLAAGAAWLTWGRIQVLHGWPRVEAEVLERRVVSTPRGSGYALEVAFAYSDKGEVREATSRTEWSTAQVSLLDPLRDRYAPGTRHTVRLHPGAADELRFDVGWSLDFFLAPFIVGVLALVFLVLGAVGARLLVRT